jgi:3',5'-cyclic AMP phosphodiesterase CpdA
VSLLVQLTDLHLRSDEGAGMPARRLEQTVRRVAELQPRLTAVLLSGDVADTPSATAYEQAHELLAPLGVAIYAIPGNHDDRDMLRSRFASETADHPGARVNVVFDCGALRVVACDSTRPGEDSGGLDAEQLDWLDRTLSARPEQATLLAFHHPPVLTGVHQMDAIAMAREDSLALEMLLERHPQVQTVTCGHAHTTMTTSFAGRPLLICPSTNSALHVDLRPREDLPFAFGDRPLGFAIHTLVDGRLVSHVQPLDQLPE